MSGVESPAALPMALVSGLLDVLGDAGRRRPPPAACGRWVKYLDATKKLTIDA